MNYAEAIEAANLTPRQKRYIQLCIIDGHPIRTVARAENLAPATIRGHIDAGLKKLKPYMRKEAA